jgi:hypothetical protein
MTIIWVFWHGKQVLAFRNSMLPPSSRSMGGNPILKNPKGGHLITFREQTGRRGGEGAQTTNG